MSFMSQLKNVANKVAEFEKKNFEYMLKVAGDDTNKYFSMCAAYGALHGVVFNETVYAVFGGTLKRLPSGETNLKRSKTFNRVSAVAALGYLGYQVYQYETNKSVSSPVAEATPETPTAEVLPLVAG